MKKKNKVLTIPNTNELVIELQKENYRSKYKRILKSTISILIIVIAVSSLVATLIFPVLEIHGNSMSPTLTEGNIVLCIKKNKFERGDIIAFYYNNRILVKRVIATSSDWVNIDDKGNIFVNDKLLKEPYVKQKELGEYDIEFPYQVAENSYFVLGDERGNSIDSRNSLIGTISNEEIIGRVILKVWPIKEFKIFK